MENFQVYRDIQACTEGDIYIGVVGPVGSGKIITTAETKFIPKEAVPVTLGTDQKVNIRFIDSVGFLVKDAAGHMENQYLRQIHRTACAGWHPKQNCGYQRRKSGKASGRHAENSK